MNSFISTLVLSLSLTFIPALAEATPSVGDNAVFAITSSSGLSATETQEVTAVNPAQDQYSVKTTTAVGAQSQVENGTETISMENAFINLATSAEACARVAQGQPAGTTASFETVNVLGQTLRSCHFHQVQTNSSGTVQLDVWFANVGFGIAKVTQVATGQSDLTMILTSFVRH